MNILISDPLVLSVPIRECGEPLVSVRDRPTLKWGSKRLPDNQIFHLVRESVARRLEEAQKQLPRGIFLQLDEGLRPRWLQRHYYREHSADLRGLHPEWDPDTLHREVTKFIADPDSAAPHTTGGAVDVCLVDAEGEEFDMGSAGDAPAHLCEGRCNTAAKNLSPAALRNRRILIDAMAASGFTNYFTEWWHWSFGDQYWGYVNRRDALYGSTLDAEREEPRR